MKCTITICCLVFACSIVSAQETEKATTTAEQQLENMAELTDAEPEDDANLQQLAYYRKNRLNLNAATADELSALNMLTGLQVQQFILYRSLLGKLVNQYELQAIPSWDIATIKKILPFIAITEDKNLAEKLQERWRGGDGILLVKYARALEKAKGYHLPAAPGGNYYRGSADRFFLRYRYNYKNVLQWGVLADKDAGEQFFKGAQKMGFDFYSFHFFARKLGMVKSIAMGDFAVSFGQGLIQWQSLAFKKNAAVMDIKRQAAALRPYNSAGEYNFHRGVGITLQKKNWETTAFVSYKKISANVNVDSVVGEGIASSFLTGGYHRTQAENNDRNSLTQMAAGGNLKYQGANWHAGINAIHYHFSNPVQKAGAPYNLFALQGSSVTNTSIDYSYTWRNIHFFGEGAVNNQFRKAFLGGAVMSLDAKADVSLLYRNIDRAYQSVNANAFTENTIPVNENGFYAGLSLRPVGAWQVNAYADVFQFPWLRYRVDAPSAGKDFFVQVTYHPNKLVEVYARFKSETKMINRPADNLVAAAVDAIAKKNIRLQSSVVINRELTVRNRVEVLWYNAPAAGGSQGFLCYADLFYTPAYKKWSGNGRLQYFETGGYNERIYAYESDLPYSFSIPFYYDKGMRYYLNINWDAGKLVAKKKKSTSLDIALRWSQTIYAGKTVVGSGLDETSGNRRSEIKLQVILKQ